MRHHIHQIILLFILCCTSIRSAAQAPSGFDYYTKEQVEATIADENATDPVYYYIQFYYQNMVTYLADFKVDDETDANLGTKDYFPFAKNIQWRLVAAGNVGQFKLQSANGYYVYYDQNGGTFYDGGQYRTTKEKDNATVFDIRKENGVLAIFNTNLPDDAKDGYAGLRRYAVNVDNPFAKEFRNWSPSNDWGKLRFARLKENAAHIIYRDDTYSNGDTDGVGNRRYIDYDMKKHLSPGSRSAATWISTLLAENYQDGLWVLDGSEDGFYIRKYGEDTKYLTFNKNTNCTLGDESEKTLVYLEDIYANRYSRVTEVGTSVRLDTFGDEDLNTWEDGNNNWKAGFAPVDPSTLTKEQFFLRFSNETDKQNMFVTDMGAGNQMQAKEENEYILARTWYINYLDNDKAGNKFTLESGLGNYVYLDGENFKTTNDATQATTFGFKRMDNEGAYAICPYNDKGELDITKSMNCIGKNATVNAKEADIYAKLEIVSMSPQPANGYTYRIRFRNMDNGERRYFTANDADTKVTLEAYKNGEDYSRQRWTLGGDSNQNFTLKSETGNYAGMYNTEKNSYNENLKRDDTKTQLFTTKNNNNATPFKLSYFEGEWGTSNVVINLPNDNLSDEYESKMLAYIYGENSRIGRWEHEDVKSRIMFVYDPLPVPEPEKFYLRFANETTNQNLFVTDMGVDEQVQANANNTEGNGRAWYINYQGKVGDNKFTLKSGLGYYVYLDGDNNFKTTNSINNATTFGFKRMDNEGSYAICPYNNGKLDIDQCMNYDGTDVNASGWSDKAKLEIISVSPQPANGYTYRIRFRDLDKNNNYARRYFTANDADKKVTLETYKNKMDYSRQRWTLSGDSNQNFTLRSEAGNYAGMYSIKEKTYNNNLNRSNSNDEGTQLFTTKDDKEATPFKLSYFEGEWGTYNVEINLPDEAFFNFNNEPGKALAHLKDYKDGDKEGNQIARWEHEDASRIMFVYDPLPEYFYLRFVNETTNQNVFVTDMGKGEQMKTNLTGTYGNGSKWQIIYQAKNTLEEQIEANQFILKSGLGNYVYLEGTNFKTTSERDKASTLCFLYNSTDGGSYAICDYNTYKGAEDKSNPKGCMKSESGVENGKNVIVWNRDDGGCALEIISLDPQTGSTYRLRPRLLRDDARTYWTDRSAYKTVTLAKGDNHPIDCWYWTVGGNSTSGFTFQSALGNYADMVNNETWPPKPNEGLNADKTATQLYTTKAPEEATPFLLQDFKVEQGTFKLRLNLKEECFTTTAKDIRYLTHLDESEGDNMTIWRNEDKCDLMFVFDPMAYVSNNYLRDAVDYEITPKESYLRSNYYKDGKTDMKESTGLAQDKDSEWKINQDGIHKDKQKTNEFRITHYVKKGEIMWVSLPTNFGKDNNNMVNYQRWYNYNTENTSSLFEHAYFDVRDKGRLQGYEYRNGFVTSINIYQNPTLTEPVFCGSTRNYVIQYFYYTNPDGNDYTMATDVSRYSDYVGLNTDGPLNSNLTEPTLGMRYIYEFKDAKEMAEKLTECTGEKWLEEKTIHFPQYNLPYEDKKANYKGEFIQLSHEDRDYWVFSGNENEDKNLKNIDSGCKFIVESSSFTTDDETGVATEEESSITDVNKYEKRFIHFSYPKDGMIPVKNCGEDNPTVIRVYLTDGETRYQVAKFTIIFDEGGQTIPWKSKGSVDGTLNGRMPSVSGTSRDPRNLIKENGTPIAKITFDYPEDAYYITPSGKTYMGDNSSKKNEPLEEGAVDEHASPLPLKFDNTSYGYANSGAEWGSYTILNQQTTTWGLNNKLMPSNDPSYIYADNDVSAIDADDDLIKPDAGLQRGFIYIDASELPGSICTIPFQGSFCSEDVLRCSGWISGANSANDNKKCPGSVILTVKGKRYVQESEEIEEIYSYCPGQVSELSTDYTVGGEYADGENSQWQQFYFTFSIDKYYDEYWLEVNNNCVNSNGGDFMLDNIEIYTPVPVVTPELNTPRCVESKDTEVMNLLKISVSFDKLLKTKNDDSEATGDDNTNNSSGNLNVAFLDRDLFLETFRDNVNDDDEIKNLSLDEIDKKLLDGEYADNKYEKASQIAFDAALMGEKGVWSSANPKIAKGNGLLTYVWSTDFENGDMTEFSFEDAVDEESENYKPLYKNTAEREIIINGNYSGLRWKEDTQYYVVSDVGTGVTWETRHEVFNVTSRCARISKYTLMPSYKILGNDVTVINDDEYQVCDGKTITITTNLSGYTIGGETVQLEDLNYDWWLGDIVRKSDGEFDAEKSTIPTLKNFYAYKRDGVSLSNALSHYRQDYTDISPLSGSYLDAIYGETPADKTEPAAEGKNLTAGEKELLKKLIDEGKLIMGSRSLTTEAFQQQMIDEANNIGAFYLVASPILDATLVNRLKYVAPDENTIYVCDNPQQLKIRLEGVSPSLNSGFVNGANGIDTYNYRTNLSTLSVRMANEQFETLLHSSDPEKGITLDENRGEDDNLLFLPVRDAKVGMTDGNATGVISKADDYNVYLSSTTDPDWDREIQTSINKSGLPPIVGKVVDLQAIDTDREGTDANNRLVIYFYGDDENGVRKFDVREGYNYTLKVPYQENGSENTCTNALLIDLKIVPDYEVWTGGAGNTDWNNDENWRRADGNTEDNDLNDANELYWSGEGYVTNKANYRTDMDRVLRKGFAPLYCTRVLMMNTEWGNAPKLYDALDSENNTTKTLVNAPFPNLRDQDDWDGEGAAATASEIIKFDMQVRSKAKWSEIYEEKPTLALDNTIYDGDLFAEMYQPNTCNEIAFQAGTELLNAHLLNYNTAWVEHELNLNRWYLMGSSLQGTIAGEWYAPTGNAKQQTTYFAPVTFGDGYDRFSPAFYQRGWDKAKTVLYQVKSEYSTGDASEDNLGNPYGLNEKDSVVKDEYLYRLGYRWLGTNKGNVAIKGTWSNTYNDVTVDYSTGGFTVKALNNLKGNDSEGTTIVRLPKEDTEYNYYGFDDTTGGTETQIDSIQTKLDRAKNRGRLKTDLLLPTDDNFTTMWLTDENATYGSRQISRVPTTEDGVTNMNGAMNTITEALPAGQSNLGFYLVGNPFQTGLDMDKFFAEEKNNENLEKKFWIMTANGQMLTVKDVLTENWITQKSEAGSETFEATNAVVAPGQGFFVQATNKDEFDGKVYFTRDMQARTRNGKMSGTGTPYTIVVGTKQKTDENGELIYDGGTPVMENIEQEVTIFEYVSVKDDGQPNYTLRARQRQSPTPSAQFTITAKSGTQQSSALLTLNEQSSNEFMPAEDTELFMADELATAPYVYTLCGHLATVVNRLHDFRSIPIGLENAQPGQQTTLRFNGVEALGDSVTIYDALTEETIELQEGTELAVKGNTLGRYFLVRGGISEESVEPVREISITHKGSQVTVTSTADALLNVRAYSTDGKLLHSANPGTPDYTFTLPSASGPIIIEASTAESSKTKKLLIH